MIKLIDILKEIKINDPSKPFTLIANSILYYDNKIIDNLAVNNMTSIGTSIPKKDFEKFKKYLTKDYTIPDINDTIIIFIDSKWVNIKNKPVQEIKINDPHAYKFNINDQVEDGTGDKANIIYRKKDYFGIERDEKAASYLQGGNWHDETNENEPWYLLKFIEEGEFLWVPEADIRKI